MSKHVLLSLDHLLSKECKHYPAQTDEQYLLNHCPHTQLGSES